jgi:hypothetical protein
MDNQFYEGLGPSDCSLKWVGECAVGPCEVVLFCVKEYDLPAAAARVASMLYAFSTNRQCLIGSDG